jgi:WD40 repeat protein/serine/threonine protein kinase
VKDRANGITSSGDEDPALVQLVDDMADRLQAGEPVDWEAVAREHPEHVERVRRMFPAIEAMADFGSVTGRGPSQSPPLEFGSSSVLGELGDYRILREIGRGGMGVVYEAVQISLGRRVALKILPFAPALDSRQLQRFQNEARAAAHLNHANLVPVYAVGCERGVHYYAMQYIDGQSLSALVEALRQIERRADEAAARQSDEAFVLASELASGRFAPVVTATVPGEQTEQRDSRLLGAAGEIAVPSTPAAPTSATSSSIRSSAYFRTVARMGMQAAEALEHAHQQGVIHRDIKPSNLLVDMRGNLWVADFGLARFQSEAGLTMTGDLLGTLRYMSPEQALGKSGMADYRTDIYSLGVTLYELLTLEPTYAGRDRQEILRRIAFEEPRPPRRINPAIPADLETIVLKAMAKDPVGRYASAQELADELGRYVNHEPIRARRTNAWERSVKWAQRRPAVAFLLATTVMAFLVGFAGVTWQWFRAERARQAVTETNSTLRKTLYFKGIALAERELAVNNLRRVDQLLADCPSDLRGWEWNYLERARSGYVPVVCRAGSPVVDVAFSPDGARLVTAQLDGSAVIWDAATGKVVHALRGPGKDVRGVAYSPDGWRVVSNSFTEVMIWDAMTGELRRTLKRAGVGNGWGVDFSRNGRMIAATVWDGNLTGDDTAASIWDSTSYQLMNTLHHPHGFKLLTFSPDGTLVAGSEDQDDVTVIDVTTGKAVWVLSGHTGGAHRPAFSPDGRYLAVACGPLHTETHGSIKLWDVLTGRLLRTLEGHTKIVWGVAFSRDGERLASGSFDYKVKIWDPSTGQEALTLHGHTNTVPAVAFSPDGWRLATASEDGTIRIWDASPITEPPARQLGTLSEHSDEVRALAFSADGQWLASAGDDMVVRLWDATSGRFIRPLRNHTSPISGLAFSPNGRRIISADHFGKVVDWETETGSVAFEIRNPEGAGATIGGVAHSPDGLTFATVGVDSGAVRDASNGRTLRKLAENNWMTYCVAYSPDSRWIATGSREGVVNVSEAATGRTIKTMSVQASRINAVAYSPDGRQLAAAASDGSIQIWDASNWAEGGRFMAHKGGALGLAYSPDGVRIASGGADETIRIWDRASRRELLTLRGHRGEVNAVTFSPDGKRLASASGDHSVKIWDVMPGPAEGP